MQVLVLADYPEHSQEDDRNWHAEAMCHLESARDSHVASVVGVSQAQAGEMDMLQGIRCQAAPPATAKPTGLCGLLYADTPLHVVMTPLLMLW